MWKSADVKRCRLTYDRRLRLIEVVWCDGSRISLDYPEDGAGTGRETGDDAETAALIELSKDRLDYRRLDPKTKKPIAKVVLETIETAGMKNVVFAVVDGQRVFPNPRVFQLLNEARNRLYGIKDHYLDSKQSEEIARVARVLEPVLGQNGWPLFVWALCRAAVMNGQDDVAEEFRNALQQLPIR